ncbi:ABC transporter C family member 5 [Capsicum chinense]|nr:ABC transporter C family member 5 [Capsicum chinense]
MAAADITLLVGGRQHHCPTGIPRNLTAGLSAMQMQKEVCVISSEILQMASWAASFLVLYRTLNRKYIKFPWILRIWWISIFFLSLARVILDSHFVITSDEHLGLADYVDILGLTASACLMCISIKGKTGIIFDISDHTTEPLLNGKKEKHSEAKRDNPYGKASLLQQITFSWLNPLFEVGVKKPIDQDEVPDVDFRDSAKFLSDSFDESLKYVKEMDGTTNPSIYKALYIFARKKAAINALFAVISAGSAYVGPCLIDDFVNFLNEKKLRGLRSGYFLALTFLGAKMVETIAQRQWIFGARQLGLRVRAALISHIYQKGLLLSSQSRQSYTNGEIMNYMSVDVQRITDFIWYLNTIWMLPVQISLAIYILHMNLGMGALVALGATVIVMTGNIPLVSTQKGYQTKIMESKDERMKSTSEILRNMKTIKLQAWDNYYLQKLEILRKVERNWLWKSLRLSALTSFIFWGSPAFISVATFSGCVMMGIPLTAGRVLSALATFRMLQDPIFNLPDLLSVMAQGKVSADRIASYLQQDEIQPDAVEFVPKVETQFGVEIKSGTFSWDTESRIPTLDGIELQAKRGMKVAICGTVGSGKSSLLSCVLGEMSKLSGIVKISGEVAYVPQSPWILSGNIKENVLFGKPYESVKYDRTVDACSLKKDFELFPAGDLTEIGERGINMSGGQKQRIQLARAVYQDADIYLLDDPFSAVDAHTGTHLFQECLMRVLKGKTILYVTHQVEFLPAADLILVMRNGRIAQAGTFEELLKQNIGFEVLVGAHNQALESILTVESSSRVSEHAVTDGEIDTDSNIDAEFPHTTQDSEHNLCVQITEKDGRLVQDEEREKGSIGKEVYISYLTTVKGGAFVPIILLAQSSFQVLQIASNYWMAWSCPTGDAAPIEEKMNFILFVYVLLAVGSSLCVLVRSSFVVITGLRTAEKLFRNMLHSILRAPMSFFDSTPTGRILNRVSTDQSVLDLEMANKLGWCAFSIIQLIGTIAVMSQAAWEVFAIFIPVTAVCIWYQQYYIPTARELARLSGVQRAPILHHFGESLAGAATIRAFNQKDRFAHTNLCFIDDHSRPWFHNVSAMEWLSFRLNQLSNFVFAFSLVLLVSLPEGIINPSIAGLAVTYGINLNILQASVIWNICNAENKMISVERILQYSNLASEAPLVIENSRPSSTWPETGTISFQTLQIRYAEHLPSVLKNITCTLPGGKKVGVVGRTGSGKSSLIQALFRIVEPQEGSISIDDIDICKIGLHDLRSRLSIIPQDPTMFEGTVRGNLDPLAQHSDTEIWEALDKCQLGDIICGKPEKLESTVVENGENWSVGQRQLFCLGRALLKKSSILVLDEATASVDAATDAVLQKIISQEFRNRTVVTIAHRIHTVIDSDLILVLNEDIVNEYNDTLGFLGVQQVIVSFPSKKYYEIIGDQGIRTLLSYVNDKFDVINLFAVKDSKLPIDVENIVRLKESVVAVDKADSENSDCNSDETANDSGNDSDYSDYDSEELEGLLEAVKIILPNAMHRYCMRHIEANWRRNRKISKQMSKIVWWYAWSTYKEKLDDNLKELAELSEEVKDELLHFPIKTWCGVFLDTVCKNQKVESNLTESFNSWILEARDKAIIGMLEAIRIKVMKKFVKHEKEVKSWDTKWSPKDIEIYNEYLKIANVCELNFNGDYGVWELTGIPCPHAIKELLYKESDPREEIHWWYTKETYLLTYYLKLQPVPGPKFWKIDPAEAMEPAPLVTLAGRPATIRKRDKDEALKRQTEWAVTRRGRVITCSTYGLPGHNARGCQKFHKMSSEGTSKSGQFKSKKQMKDKQPMKSKPSMKRRRTLIDEEDVEPSPSRFPDHAIVEDVALTAPQASQGSASTQRQLLFGESFEYRGLKVEKYVSWKPRSVSEFKSKILQRQKQPKPIGSRQINFFHDVIGSTKPSDLYAPKTLSWNDNASITGRKLEELRVDKLKTRKGNGKAQQ